MLRMGSEKIISIRKVTNSESLFCSQLRDKTTKIVKLFIDNLSIDFLLGQLLELLRIIEKSLKSTILCGYIA